jgi:hypothetical protein
VLKTVGKTARESCSFLDAFWSAAASGLRVGILRFEYEYRNRSRVLVLYSKWMECSIHAAVDGAEAQTH